MDIDTFIKAMNDLRKSNKNKWCQFVGVVDGKKIELKFFETWNQILRIEGITFPTMHELNVSEWKNELIKALKYKF